MTALELTIQVLGLAPRVTLGDLHTFFSYCGTVDKIQLNSINKDQSQTALVSFKQPFAYQTALLLDYAIFAGQAIRIVPATDFTNSPSPDKLINNKTKGVEMLKKTKEEIEENYKLTEKSTMLVEQARSLVCATEQAAGYVASKIAYTGANWLSNVLDNASKRTADLGRTGRRNNPNSRK
ncbi:hypothetical protein Ddye_029519 [Dipteronia dyeriana]|uniref:RRM domain-containing protein n=1 Tax=Dipteronia dyeriana TaxID=168575 RepID=A0AAD9WLJ9_9ROSI|nr:hypothetical protein Ddye_029519 [Dipteronia dyeriana]